jgi:hypothetical protein
MIENGDYRANISTTKACGVVDGKIVEAWVREEMQLCYKEARKGLTGPIITLSGAETRKLCCQLKFELSRRPRPPLPVAPS